MSSGGRSALVPLRAFPERSANVVIDPLGGKGALGPGQEGLTTRAVDADSRSAVELTQALVPLSDLLLA